MESAKKSFQKTIDFLKRKCLGIKSSSDFNAILSFIEHNYSSIERTDLPFCSSVRLELTDETESIRAVFAACQSAFDDGVCSIDVWKDGEPVFSASGNFVTDAFNVKTEINLPGAWRRTFNLNGDDR